MLTLSLLRHAEAATAGPRQDDHDRQLTPRGRAEAARMGAWLGGTGIRPGFVLCSAAVRARDTLALLLAMVDWPPPAVVHQEALYLASSTQLLESIRRAAGANPHVLLVAHNPGLHSLALGLIRSGSRNETAALAAEFPTASLAVIECDIDHWRELGPAAGHLRMFMSPRLLP
jgi:phosphohistidine phosphatase